MSLSSIADAFKLVWSCLVMIPACHEVAASWTTMPHAGLSLKVLDVATATSTEVQLSDRTVKITRLARQPHVFQIDGIFNKTERRMVVRLARKEQFFASVTTSGRETPWRQSRQAWVRKDSSGADPMIKIMSKRVAQLLSVPIEAVEGGHPLQVLRYDAGGYYWPHYDSRHLDDLSPEPQTTDYDTYGVHAGYPFSARAATMFCILLSPTSGGSTVLPLADTFEGGPPYPTRAQADALSSSNVNAHKIWEEKMPGRCNGEGKGTVIFHPRAGSCLLFYNHHLLAEGGRIGELDRRSLHGACEVKEGKKWAMNWWLETQLPFGRAGTEALHDEI
eukprot:TRINITY_DN29876_c0_g1_i1.p1 TRINITY_DN29876_c0_g1~~TRINITY_DN29876_c0_g1_i1.p1  ORF type:complete len:333 (-),score=43.51 TRINITY_DN29876_c0_g1_i1:541-1539(-)